MSQIRTGRQKYYNIFSHFYDAFINMHSGRHKDETRQFLTDSVQIKNNDQTRILDVCCGTGSVILAFWEKYPNTTALGYDFSSGMLSKAMEKDQDGKVGFIQGDAARLSFCDNTFDVVCCSHALYELKGPVREEALFEMKRVVKPDGNVLIMEHEVPKRPVIKILFYLRMLMMGSTDAKEFLQQDRAIYQRIFETVTLSHTPSGKSKLLVCRK